MCNSPSSHVTTVFSLVRSRGAVSSISLLEMANAFGITINSTVPTRGYSASALQNASSRAPGGAKKIIRDVFKSVASSICPDCPEEALASIRRVLEVDGDEKSCKSNLSALVLSSDATVEL